jgi:hypothetical protein
VLVLFAGCQGKLLAANRADFHENDRREHKGMVASVLLDAVCGSLLDIATSVDEICMQ